MNAQQPAHDDFLCLKCSSHAHASAEPHALRATDREVNSVLDASKRFLNAARARGAGGQKLTIASRFLADSENVQPARDGFPDADELETIQLQERVLGYNVIKDPLFRPGPAHRVVEPRRASATPVASPPPRPSAPGRSARKRREHLEGQVLITVEEGPGGAPGETERIGQEAAALSARLRDSVAERHAREQMLDRIGELEKRYNELQGANTAHGAAGDTAQLAAQVVALERKQRLSDRLLQSAGEQFAAVIGSFNELDGFVRATGANLTALHSADGRGVAEGVARLIERYNGLAAQLGAGQARPLGPDASVAALTREMAALRAALEAQRLRGHGGGLAPAEALLRDLHLELQRLNADFRRAAPSPAHGGVERRVVELHQRVADPLVQRVAGLGSTFTVSVRPSSGS